MLDLLPGIQSTASALTAERLRMDVIGQNIANVHTTRGLDGRPYQRQQVVFETVFQQQLGDSSLQPRQSVQISRIEQDLRPPKLIHDPGHPDADARGMVAFPDINVFQEMVDMMAASRAFEANLSVVKNAQVMAMQALSLGKRS